MAGREVRAYEKSHPWITFGFNMRELPYTSWILLGEAKSKCKHIAEAPLLPSYHEKLMNVYLVKGAFATTAIEGNTLTEEQVKDRIQGKLNLPPSKEYLGKEIDNVVDAYNFISDQIFIGTTNELSVDCIKKYNAMVLDKLPITEDINPGIIRGYNVGVGNYKGVPYQDCEYLLTRYAEWLNDEFPSPDGQEIIFGILKAILAHLYFVWIHPFGDGNGRTARMIEFQILLSVGVPAAAAHIMSNHYNITRTEYYRQLDNASKSGGNIIPFINYALQGFVDGLNEQIELIQKQQLDVHWINYIHSHFSEKDSAVDKRRRNLILELSNTNESIPINKIRRISAKVAEMYAGSSDKTIQRDVEALLVMELLRRDKHHVICNFQAMQSFLSRTRVAS